MSYPREALIDTGAFVLGGDVRWCRFGRPSKSGAPKVLIQGCGYVRCEPAEILAVRSQYLTRAEVAARFGLSLEELALMIAEECRGWSAHGRKSIRVDRLDRWAEARSDCCGERLMALQLIEGGGEGETERTREARLLVVAGYRAAIEKLHFSDADYYRMTESRSEAEVLARNMDYGPVAGA